MIKENYNLGFTTDESTDITKYGAILPKLTDNDANVTTDALAAFLCENHSIRFRQIKDTKFHAAFMLGCSVQEKDGTLYMHFDRLKGEIIPNFQNITQIQNKR